MKNIKKALEDISLKLTREIRSIIRQRDHINTGLLISNIYVEAAYNPLASKTSFTIIYDAPYYWLYVDALSPQKKLATWTTTCTQALKQSDTYKECRDILMEALEKDNVPLNKKRSEISDIIGGAIRVLQVKEIISNILK